MKSQDANAVVIFCFFLFILVLCGHSEGADLPGSPAIPDISGKWNSDFGILDFTQDGNKVRGTYSCCNGIITGTIKGNRFRFTWQDPVYGKGWGVFVLNDDGRRLIGKWGINKETTVGEWNAWRTGDRPPAGNTPATPKISQTEGDRLLQRAMELWQNTDYQEAAREFRKARAFFEQQGAAAKIDQADIGLAQCLASAGQYEEARRLYRKVLDSSGDETTKLLAQAGLAMVEVELGRIPALPPEASEPLPPDDPAELRDRGLKLLNAGRFAQSIDILEKALSGYAALNSSPNISHNMRESNLISQGDIFTAMAYACCMLKDYQRAIRHGKNALKIWEKVGSEPNIAQAYSALGIFCQKSGHTEQALDFFLKAVQIQERKGLLEVWQTWNFLAKLNEDMEAWARAASYYEKSVSTIEKLRAGLRTDEAKIGFLSLKVAPFDDYVIFLIEHKPAKDYRMKALEITERARARALVELLVLGRDNPGSSFKPGKTRAEETEYYRRTFDEWFSPLTVTPPKADEIYRIVTTGRTAYLVYFVTDSTTYAWLLLPTGEIHLEKIELSRKKLTHLVENLRNDIHDGISQGTGEKLFNCLLAPSLKRLGSVMPECRQLTILPHDILNSLPFAALGHRQVYPLLEYSVTYLPAIGLASRLKPAGLNVTDRVLLVANPKGAGLDSADAEAEYIASLFPNSRKLAGKAADRKTVIEEMTKGYQAVLFSTHGKPDLSRPEDTYLLMAHGGRLTLKDITRLRLSAGLVVMSACETHVGKRYGGDELMALTRGFLSSGTDSVLTTLWSVEQESARRIISRFFENLRAGLLPAQALRKSQLMYLKQDSDVTLRQKRPRFWAPFIIIGKN